MDADRIRISTRGWLAVLGIPLLVVLLILQFGRMDENRREKQFRALHAFLLRPEHAEGLLPVIDRFDPSDSVVIKRIGEVLQKMTSDGSLVDQTYLIVNWRGNYYNVSMYASYNRYTMLQGRLYVNDPLEQAFARLPPGAQMEPERIYELAGGTGTLSSGMRLNNAILIASSWRERHDWE
jgi:hypothetical protein